MKVFVLTTAMVIVLAAGVWADGPYKVLESLQVGGDGGYDYVYADQAGRRLYVPRIGDQGRILVFNLDTLAPAGTIPGVSGHGVAVSVKSGHGFASSKPVVMWDTATLQVLKKVDVEGTPDGILYEPGTDTVWIFSHKPPNVTVLRAGDGSVAGTIDLGGAPEQAVSDGLGRVFVDIEDKDEVALVTAGTREVTGRYTLGGLGSECAGLAIDPEDHLLFAACRKPQVLVVLGAEDGSVRGTVPIGAGCDGAWFNSSTREALTSQGEGSLTVAKVKSDGTLEAEQTLATAPNARTSTLDQVTGRVYLLAADFGPPPADPPPGAFPRRGPMVPGSFRILVVGR